MNYPLMKPARLTVEEFRELEAHAPEDERWELINGVIYKSMAGGTRAHNVIVVNLTSALLAAFREKKLPCRPYSENMRLDVAAAELSTLPDVVVSCEHLKDGAKAVGEATAIIEVLSKSTSGRDRSDKLDAYFTVPSMRTIALVEQEFMHVALCTRVADGWLLKNLNNAEDLVEFDGLGVSLTLATIYDDVAFDQRRA